MPKINQCMTVGVIATITTTGFFAGILYLIAIDGSSTSSVPAAVTNHGKPIEIAITNRDSLWKDILTILVPMVAVVVTAGFSLLIANNNAKLQREEHKNDQFMRALELFNSTNIAVQAGAIDLLFSLSKDSEGIKSATFSIIESFLSEDPNAVELCTKRKPQKPGLSVIVNPIGIRTLFKVWKNFDSKVDGILKIRSANFALIILDNSDLIDSHFVGCDFRRCTFHSVDFTGARLTSSYFSGSEFRDCKFTDTNLSDCNFDQSIGLTQEILDGAWAYKGHQPKGLEDIKIREFQDPPDGYNHKT